MKLLVLCIIGVILYALGSAMYYMVSKNRNSIKIAKALTWRITLSLALFCFLIISFLMGWIVPHGL